MKNLARIRADFLFVIARALPEAIQRVLLLDTFDCHVRAARSQ